jgi:hypothetical protein
MRTVNRACLLLTLAWCLTALGCISGVTWTPDSTSPAATVARPRAARPRT